jgi:predicted AAA+ superfamily ATPase
MFKREILVSLRQWADSKYRKPLVLRGARQVGKTTVINEFGKEFDNYLYLNLEKPEAARLFEPPYSIHEFISVLFLYNNKPRKEGRTLIFIDEIQSSQKAVARLRYFYEESPDIFVIAAGSLLESLIDDHISFPVGRVEYMALRPCSFIEFLWATGESEFDYKNWKLFMAFHERLLRLFTTYALIGGMPEIVKRYAEEKDIIALGNVYETLLQGYRDDVEKYSKGKNQPDVILYILSEGCAKAGQAIKLCEFAGSPYKARETRESFRTLEKTFILELVYPITETRLPVVSNQNRSPKLIWLDVGLVNYAVNLREEYFNAQDVADIWQGMIAEQIVAQELLTLSHEITLKRNFWVRDKEGSKAEVDFIWIYNSTIIPIEVKTGSNAHLRSLHSFMERSPYSIAVRIWKEPFSINEVKTIHGKIFSLINLPYYLIGAMEGIIEEVMKEHELFHEGKAF